jgi:hypothetical protein
LAELLLEKPFFLENIIKCFLNIWLYKHRRNKRHIFFKYVGSVALIGANLTVRSTAGLGDNSHNALNFCPTPSWK